MRILAFDTATAATAVALIDDGAGLIVERRDDPPLGSRPRHTTRLMKLIVEAMGEAGLGWAEIDRLGVGVGPGTFTGLRIGVSTARALAAARGLPLVGVSTLRSLALGAASDGPVVAVIDARRGEAFAACWPSSELAGGGSEPLLGPAALDPDALADALSEPGRRWLAVGEGALKFRAAIEATGAIVPEDDSVLHRVSAVHHCRLASASQPADLALVRPDYLRAPDAELTLRAAAAAPGR